MSLKAILSGTLSGAIPWTLGACNILRKRTLFVYSDCLVLRSDVKNSFHLF